MLGDMLRAAYRTQPVGDPSRHSLGPTRASYQNHGIRTETTGFIFNLGRPVVKAAMIFTFWRSLQLRSMLKRRSELQRATRL